MEKELVVNESGETICELNQTLIKKQNLSPETVELIKHQHIRKYETIKLMKSSRSSSNLRSLANIITEIEFTLQELWGFGRNIAYHRFWELPQCKCPKMDNSDNYPTGYYVRVENCPIHGWKTNNGEE